MVPKLTSSVWPVVIRTVPVMGLLRSVAGFGASPAVRLLEMAYSLMVAVKVKSAVLDQP